jgi:hypothetical protein
MTDKYKDIKTTCTKKDVFPVLPQPTAIVLAEIVGVSESYAKKVRTGNRSDKSETAELVKYCNELIIGGQEVLIKSIHKIITNHKSTQK